MCKRQTHAPENSFEAYECLANEFNGASTVAIEHVYSVPHLHLMPLAKYVAI